MSQNLLEALRPLRVMPVDEAREMFNRLTESQPELPQFAKGKDIGRVVTERLIGQGARPERAPLFSLIQTAALEGFLSEFGVTETGSLQGSVPVHLAGCAVHTEMVRSLGGLHPHEAWFPIRQLPAIRIHFEPREI